MSSMIQKALHKAKVLLRTNQLPANESNREIKKSSNKTQIIVQKYLSQTKQDIKNRVTFLDHPMQHIRMMRAFSEVLSLSNSNNKDEQQQALEKNRKQSLVVGKNTKTLEMNDFTYYVNYEKLKEDWDLKDTQNLEDDYYRLQSAETNKQNSNMSMEELKIIESNSKKYRLLRKDYMILGTGRKEWNKGKKMLGILYPTLSPMQFYYDELVFISPDIAQKKYGVQDKLDIFDKDGKLADTGKLYAYIATHNYSDFIFYQYDSSVWSAWGTKDGKSILISESAFTNKEAQLLIQALLRDMELNTNNQDFNVTGTVHMKSFDNFGEDGEIPIGEKTFRIDMTRQFKSSIAKGSQKFPRTVNIRMLETGTDLRKPESIGYYPEDLEIINMALRTGDEINTGCVIYSGAPSSGKSTSINSMFADLHENYNAQIITVDTAVEFEHDGFRQISLDDTKTAREDKRVTIEQATNDMLKQFANALMVGEVRDENQIQAFIKASERGRLMAGTLHTTNVRSVFTVLQNAGLKPYQFLPSLNIIVHHTLVPAICKHCKNATDEKEVCEYCGGTKKYDKELVYEYAFIIKDKIPLDVDPAKDFNELVKSGVIIYRSKAEIAERKFKDGLIAEDVFMSLSGKNIEEIIKKIKNDKE